MAKFPATRALLGNCLITYWDERNEFAEHSDFRFLCFLSDRGGVVINVCKGDGGFFHGTCDEVVVKPARWDGKADSLEAFVLFKGII